MENPHRDFQTLTNNMWPISPADNVSSSELYLKCILCYTLLSATVGALCLTLWWLFIEGLDQQLASCSTAINLLKTTAIAGAYRKRFKCNSYTMQTELQQMLSNRSWGQILYVCIGE